MSGPANPHRGEAALEIGGALRNLRPSFTALVERAGSGELKLSEMTALFWHCLTDKTGLSREDVGAAIMQAGLARCAPALRILLGQILQGQA